MILGIGAIAIGAIMMLMSLNNHPSDNSYWGGWVFIIIGVLSLFGWFINLIG